MLSKLLLTPLPERGPKCGQIKNKKIGLYFKNQSSLSTLKGPKIVFEPDPNHKNSPMGAKKLKKNYWEPPM